MEFIDIGMWEQTFQINNSYNKFITCNSSKFYHQIFHIKYIYLYIVSNHNIYIYIYQYHHINKFLGFSRGQHLCPINRVVLSPFRTRTSFSSIFLRMAPLEPKGALPCYLKVHSLAKELSFRILNGILPC